MSQIANNQPQTQSDDTKESQNAQAQERTGYYNDSNLQTANIYLSKTASIAFLELQGGHLW